MQSAKSKKLLVKMQEGSQEVSSVSAAIYAWGRRARVGVLRTKARRVNDFYSKMGMTDGSYLQEKEWMAAMKKKIGRILVPDLEKKQAQAIKSVQQELLAYLERELTGTMASGFRGRHCFFRLSVRHVPSSSHSDQILINAFSGIDEADLIGISIAAEKGKVRLLVRDHSKHYDFLSGKKDTEAAHSMEKLEQVVAGIKKQVRGYRFVKPEGNSMMDHDLARSEQRKINGLIDVSKLLK